MDDDDCDCKSGAPPWMATFSDMATLLLTFFILLLSFAQLNVIDFREALGSIRDAFGMQEVQIGRFSAVSADPVELNNQPTTRLTNINEVEQQAMQSLRSALARAGLSDDVDVLVSPRGIIIRVKDRVLFTSGSAVLKPEARPILDEIVQLADVFTDNVGIEGHTDFRPIHSSLFPSNWELSSGRAISVLRYFVDAHGIDRNRIHVAGYADTRPIAANDSEYNLGRNRRVEFLFQRPVRPLGEESVVNITPIEELPPHLRNLLGQGPSGEEDPRDPEAGEGDIFLLGGPAAGRGRRAAPGDDAPPTPDTPGTADDPPPAEDTAGAEPTPDTSPEATPEATPEPSTPAGGFDIPLVDRSAP